VLAPRGTGRMASATLPIYPPPPTSRPKCPHHYGKVALASARHGVPSRPPNCWKRLLAVKAAESRGPRRVPNPNSMFVPAPRAALPSLAFPRWCQVKSKFPLPELRVTAENAPPFSSFLSPPTDAYSVGLQTISASAEYRLARHLHMIRLLFHRILRQQSVATYMEFVGRR
jgi:hypothetical protein